MITTIIFDFSRVLLFPKDDTYTGGLNELHKKVRQQPNYHLFNHFVYNKELGKYLKTLSSRYDLHLFTSESIQTDQAVKSHMDEIFRRVFSAYDLGVTKSDPKAYEKVAKLLRKEPSEILFIDDSDGNLKAAKTAGLLTHKYLSNEEIMEYLTNLET